MLHSSIGLYDVLPAEFISSYNTPGEGCALLPYALSSFLFFFFRKYMKNPTAVNVAPNVVPPTKMKMPAITKNKVK